MAAMNNQNEGTDLSAANAENSRCTGDMNVNGEAAFGGDSQMDGNQALEKCSQTETNLNRLLESLNEDLVGIHNVHPHRTKSDGPCLCNQATCSSYALEAIKTNEQETNAQPLLQHECNGLPADIFESLGDNPEVTDPCVSQSLHSICSYVCRICHNAENPELLVSPCLCKGSLSYVHIHCLERWISTSRSTTCELCQFKYNTVQTLRYSCIQSLRMWYSRQMSRRALQEDCQMFSLLTLVAFGIIGTLLVGMQYYFLQGRTVGIGTLWTKGWLIFFLFTTLAVYLINTYMILKSQLTPWYRWWQSARDIKLILENRKPYPIDLARRQYAVTTLGQMERDVEQQPVPAPDAQSDTIVMQHLVPKPMSPPATDEDSNSTAAAAVAISIEGILCELDTLM